jgi:sulfur carrier protein
MLAIVVNGEAREVERGSTVVDLLRALGLGEVRVAVEVNRQIVPRARHGARVLEDGDTIEIVHFVGGG